MAKRKAKPKNEPPPDIFDRAWWLITGQQPKKPRKRRKPPRAKKWPVLHFLGLSWIPRFIEWDKQITREMNRDDKRKRDRAVARRNERAARKAAKAGTSMEDRVKRKRDGKFNGSEKAEDVPAPEHGKRIRFSEARKRGGAYDDASAPVESPDRERPARPADDVAAGGRVVMARDATGAGGSPRVAIADQAARLRKLHN